MNYLAYLVVKLLVSLPISPHWLHSLKYEEGNRHIFQAAFRQRQAKKVLEVGAGDGYNKKRLLTLYPKLTYTATDFSSWDKEFQNVDNYISRFGFLIEPILGFRKREPLDGICDAMSLPYRNGSFDYHLSFETLEHLNSPERYFAEAVRILKKDGWILLSVPYMFRMHGGEPDHRMDYYRYSAGFFYEMAKRYNLKVIEIYANTGLGTTVSTMINQWLILRLGDNPISKLCLSIIFVPVFLLTNVLGWLADLWPDKRFATHFHVIMKKK